MDSATTMGRYCLMVFNLIALEPWVIRHFGTAGPTWAICKKIARDGIPARKALLADSIEPDVHAAIDKAVGEAIEKLLGG